MTIEPGKLYVVATPIGNLADLSFRALDTLKNVDLIAAEDTRHIKMLLNHYGINNALMALHQHNEERACAGLIEKLQAGLSIALVSDAGTPLLSDPGLPLVKHVKEMGLDVVPIPGACALIAALSVAGLPVSPFYFAGFSPRTSSARKTFFTEQMCNPITWIFYESSHRILASIEDLADVLTPDRNLVIAREITKLHETIIKASLNEMLALVRNNEMMRKGEFVVIVEGAPKTEQATELSEEDEKILRILLKECTIKSAVAMAVEITGAKKKILYQTALAIQNQMNSK